MIQYLVFFFNSLKQDVIDQSICIIKIKHIPSHSFLIPSKIKICKILNVTTKVGDIFKNWTLSYLEANFYFNNVPLKRIQCHFQTTLIDTSKCK